MLVDVSAEVVCATLFELPSELEAELEVFVAKLDVCELEAPLVVEATVELGVLPVPAAAPAVM